MTRTTNRPIELKAFIEKRRAADAAAAELMAALEKLDELDEPMKLVMEVDDLTDEEREKLDTLIAMLVRIKAAIGRKLQARENRRRRAAKP